MRRVYLSLAVVLVVGGAPALSGQRLGRGGLVFEGGERRPVTHLRVSEDDAEFRFVVVSDRTGGHRANVFAQAVEKIKLLQPEFVLSVGDLIEGGKKTDKLEAEWQEFDGFVRRLDMPFFYVPGNHDVASAESTKVWRERFGRTHYHFVYRDVLFLILNSDDPSNVIGKAQVDEALKVLEANRNVRWTIVALHRPLWTVKNGEANGWGPIEKALAGRRYTVFVGHEHEYRKFVRNGQNYYQLATTGGVSLMRGLEMGEFDHVVWVTMKKDGPVLANILLDSIHNESLTKFATNEPVERKQKPTHLVRGKAYFEGSPIPGARVVMQPRTAKSAGQQAEGIVGADGSFLMSTYTANDGAAEGDYGITVTWRRPVYDVDGVLGPNLLPVRYAKGATSGLQTIVKTGANDLVIELKK